MSWRSTAALISTTPCAARGASRTTRRTHHSSTKRQQHVECLYHVLPTSTVRYNTPNTTRRKITAPTHAAHALARHHHTPHLPQPWKTKNPKTPPKMGQPSPRWETPPRWGNPSDGDNERRTHDLPTRTPKKWRRFTKSIGSLMQALPPTPPSSPPPPPLTSDLDPNVLTYTNPAAQTLFFTRGRKENNRPTDRPTD